MRRPEIVAWAETFFLAFGTLILCICALVYFEAALYQAIESRQFESLAPSAPPAEPPDLKFIPTQGSPIGKIEIPRIGVSVVVVEGVKPRDLRIAAGHIPGTALPGEAGNVAIAAHRDTFFRDLRRIRNRDLITLTTLYGSFKYSVESTQIVAPTDVQVLGTSETPVLTLVTCYPFYYVGAAPKRFIVRAIAQ